MLTRAQVQEKRDGYAIEIEKLLNRVADLQSKLATCDEILDTPSVDEASNLRPDGAGEVPQENYMRLSDALVALAKTLRKPMVPKKYYKSLSKVGFTRGVSYQNAYNTLNRLVEKQILARSEDGEYGLPEDVEEARNGHDIFAR